MSTSTKNKFHQALHDLQEINDQLFYNELKKTMSEHVNSLQTEYEKVSEKTQEMHEQMGRFEYSFTHLTQDVLTQFRITLQKIETELSNTFEGHAQVLFNAYQLFSEIAEEQKTFIQTKDTEWRELAADVKKQQETTLNNLVEKLTLEIDKHLTGIEERVTEQQECLKKETTEQISAVQVQLQRQHEQFDTLLQTLQNEHKQYRLDTETLFQNFIVETKEALQMFNKRMDAIEKIIYESSESYALQLESDQQEHKEKWKEQEDQLVVLKNQQQHQTDLMKKWIIGLTVSQTITIIGVIGLYFF